MEQRIRTEVAGRTIEPVADPVAWLMWMAGEARAWHEACAAHVANLQPLTYIDAKGVEDVRALVAMFERSLERCVGTAAKMTQLGLTAEALRQAKERPTREQAETLNRVLDHLLAGLNLTDQQRATVPDALAHALRTEGLIP